jgi:hypothetical protein
MRVPGAGVDEIPHGQICCGINMRICPKLGKIKHVQNLELSQFGYKFHGTCGGNSWLLTILNV